MQMRWMLCPHIVFDLSIILSQMLERMNVFFTSIVKILRLSRNYENRVLQTNEVGQEWPKKRWNPGSMLLIMATCCHVMTIKGWISAVQVVNNKGVDEVHLVNTRRAFDSIDIAKFLGSVLIFAMHGTALRDYRIAQSALEIMARWGVPFFFISSAYFLFRKSVGGNIERKNLLHYLFRIGMLYLYWMIFNLPSIYIRLLYQKDLTDISTWLIFFKHSILSETFTGSWYLTSCIFSACIVYWLSKRFQTKAILIITLPLYLICALTSVYRGVLPKQVASILAFFCFPLNIFNGCFYFALGKYIFENESQIKKCLTKSRALMLFFVFYLVYVIEIFVAKHFNIFAYTDVAFSSVALSCVLFLFCLQSKIKINNSIVLRKLSIIIYCCQGNVLIFNHLCKRMLGGHSLIAFMMSCVVVTIISIIVFFAQEKSQWKWVHYLT